MSGKDIRRMGVTRSDTFTAIEDLANADHSFGVGSVTLDYCGSEQCRSSYVFGPYVRSSFVLHMIISGKGRLIRNGVTHQLSSGQAFLIFPGEENTYQADAWDPWNYMWVGFHGYQAEYIMAQAGFDRDHVVINCSNMQRLRQIMDQLIGLQDLTYVNELRRTSFLFELLSALVENNEKLVPGSQKPKTANDTYVDMAVNLLLEGAGDGVKVSDVAKRIGVSRNYLTTIFRERMGMSPQEFLLNYRMERAMSLLADTDNPIGLIAEAVGYSDSMSFSKAFRSRHGVSPSEYRKRHTEVQVNSQKGEYVSSTPL